MLQPVQPLWGVNFVVLVAACFLAVASDAHASGSRRALLTATDFPPRCSCIRSARAAPFVLSSPSMSGSTSFPRYCFKIQTSQYCDPKFTCCNGNQGINKIEFDVEPDCKDSLQKVTVNGKSWASYEFNGPLGVLRVTKLNLNTVTAPGTNICLFLQKSSSASSCTSLTSFCGAGNGLCKYAIFNLDLDSGKTNSQCCPVNLVGPVSPPPFPPFANASSRPPLAPPPFSPLPLSPSPPPPPPP
ncbi:hypothetical protein Vretifemale_16084, partial [Volvox reticuliferus]